MKDKEFKIPEQFKYVAQYSESIGKLDKTRTGYYYATILTGLMIETSIYNLKDLYKEAIKRQLISTIPKQVSYEAIYQVILLAVKESGDKDTPTKFIIKSCIEVKLAQTKEK